MKLFYSIIWLCISSFIIPSQSQKKSLSEVLKSSEYQSLSKQWLNAFKESISPDLGREIFDKIYDQGLPSKIRNQLFEGARAQRILDQHGDWLDSVSKTGLVNTVVVANITYRCYLRELLQDYQNKQKELLLDAQAPSVDLSQQKTITVVPIELKIREELSINSSDTTDIGIPFSDISSETSHGRSDSIGSAMPVADNVRSLLDELNKRNRFLSLKKQSDYLYQESLESQNRQKNALEIIAVEDQRRARQKSKEIVDQSVALMNDISINKALKNIKKIIDENQKKQERLKKEGKAVFGIISFQALYRGSQVRKNLASIQRQLRWDKEFILERQNLLVKQAQEKKELEDQKVNQRLKKQAENRRKRNKKKEALRVKKALVLQKITVDEKQEKITQAQHIRQLEIERKQEEKLLQSFKKEIATIAIESKSSENFKKQIIPVISKKMESVAIDDAIKQQIIEKSICDSALDLAQDGYNQCLSITPYYHGKKLFDAVVEPTCDEEMVDSFKRTSWAQVYNVTDKQIREMITIKQQVLLSGIFLQYKENIKNS